MLEGIDVRLNCDFFENKQALLALTDNDGVIANHV